jgi:hypothetical protein
MLSKLDELLWDHEKPCLEEIPMGKLPKMGEPMTGEENARDTQFHGFACMVWEEIMQLILADNRHIDRGTMPDPYRNLIARHAYDLVGHTVEHIDPKDLDVLGLEETVERIPDMTELPKEQEYFNGHYTR